MPPFFIQTGIIVRWTILINEVHKDSLRALLVIFLLTLLNLYLPLFSFLIYIIWPIPIVFIIVKHGIKQATLIIVVAAVINGLLLGAMMGLYTVVGFGLIGFFLGTSLEEDFSPLTALLLTILAVLISNILIGGIFSYILDFSYNQLFSDIIHSLENSPQFKDLSSVFEQQLQLLEAIFPALLIITSIVTGILTYYASLWYLKRKGIDKDTFKPVRYWQLPRWWLSLGIVVTLIFRTNLYLANANIVLLFLVFLQGFAVGLYYLSRVDNKFLTFLYIFTILLFNFFSFVVLALVGLIDLWFDLRKLNKSD